jgi:hypothetical protein
MDNLGVFLVVGCGRLGRVLEDVQEERMFSRVIWQGSQSNRSVETSLKGHGHTRSDIVSLGVLRV